jgi:hypothetical protein
MNVDVRKHIKLTKQPKKEKKETIDEIRETYKWVAPFSKEVQDWYISDQVMTKEQRINYLLEEDKAIRIGDIQILGNNTFYKNGEKVTLVGKNADEYAKWLEELKKRFIANKGFFATVDSGRLKFNIDEKADTLKTVERSKNIGGLSCISYHLHTMNLLAEWLGSPFPNTITTKVQRCQYISLLVRDSILKKKGLVWWTPEEWEILNDPTNRKDLVSRLK